MANGFFKAWGEDIKQRVGDIAHPKYGGERGAAPELLGSAAIQGTTDQVRETWLIPPEGVTEIDTAGTSPEGEKLYDIADALRLAGVREHTVRYLFGDLKDK